MFGLDQRRSIVLRLQLKPQSLAGREDDPVD